MQQTKQNTLTELITSPGYPEYKFPSQNLRSNISPITSSIPKSPYNPASNSATKKKPISVAEFHHQQKKAQIEKSADYNSLRNAINDVSYIRKKSSTNKSTDNINSDLELIKSRSNVNKAKIEFYEKQNSLTMFEKQQSA